LLIHETLDLQLVSATTSKGNERCKPIKCSKKLKLSSYGKGK